MFQITDYIDARSFFISFFIGIFISYIYSSKKRIVIQYPTPENAEKIIFKDEIENTCYKYKVSEISCPL
jgi:hypothetical protein